MIADSHLNEDTFELFKNLFEQNQTGGQNEYRVIIFITDQTEEVIMRRVCIHHWLTRVLFMLFVALGCQPGWASDIGWPETTAQLTALRSKAESCVRLLKGHGNKSEISRGRMNYEEAKVQIDAVISGLTTVLVQKDNPDNLPGLEIRLKQASTNLEPLCSASDNQMSDNKSVFSGIAQEAIGPLIKSISDGIAAIYKNYQKESELTRKTIQKQLDDSKWQNFANIAPVK